jgi:hypothetical protein
MKIEMKLFKHVVIIIPCVILMQACFTMKYDMKGGAQIDPKIKTLSVQYFANRALKVNPSLSQSFTDDLKDYMEKNTSLRVVNNIGDVDFSGEITEYSIKSTSIAAGDQASQTRFTITIRVKYTNLINPDDNFDTSFSRYRDISSTTKFQTVEEQLTTEIIGEIIEQIFNKAFVNW